MYVFDESSCSHKSTRSARRAVRSPMAQSITSLVTQNTADYISVSAALK